MGPTSLGGGLGKGGELAKNCMKMKKIAIFGSKQWGHMRRQDNFWVSGGNIPSPPSPNTGNAAHFRSSDKATLDS